MEVDPLEAVIKLMLADTNLLAVTGGRIDIRHHYGQRAGDWPQTAQSLILIPIGGTPIVDDFWSNMQLVAYCYGDTPYQAWQVCKRLWAFTRRERRTVTVTEGKALINYVVPLSEARFLLDDDARPEGGMPAYLVTLEIQVSEITVT